jgi:hypothetical protein
MGKAIVIDKANGRAKGITPQAEEFLKRDKRS